MFPKLSIDEYVPASVCRDVRDVVSKMRAKGWTHLFVHVPADDFAGVMNQMAPKVGYPFVPLLSGIPVMPYEGAIVAVMGREPGSSAEPKKPLLYGADGSLHEVH
jgi:hypothetical protein